MGRIIRLLLRSCKGFGLMLCRKLQIYSIYLRVYLGNALYIVLDVVLPLNFSWVTPHQQIKIL